MKQNRIFRSLGIAVILALLVVAIPATPVLALPMIGLSPTAGSIGGKVTVTGTNFASYKGDEIYILFNGTEVSHVIVPDAGNFVTDFNVPDDAIPGIAYVSIENEVGNQIGISRPFTIWETQIELYPGDGIVGTKVTVEGRGFYAGKDVTFYYYHDEGRETLSTEVATLIGECSYSFTVPASTAGDHPILAEDIAGNSAEANFEVTPSTILNPTSGAIGDRVAVSGTGFGSSSRITIYFNGDKVARDKTDKHGTFEAIFNVPPVESGSYYVEVEDDDGTIDRAIFTMAATVSLSPTTGGIGTFLIINGTGFAAGTTVIIKYDALQVATATTDTKGAFSVTFTVPTSRHGSHMVTASDDTNTVTSTFTMESTPPPTPGLLLPEDKSRSEAEAEIYFTWEDVDDPSGVSYTLQIASDADFTSIVLEKKGLTDPEYILTEEEKLQPTELLERSPEQPEESPYYWRVRAIDGASNEGEWSTPRSFYVGSASALPGWVKWILIVLGALLLGWVLFWLGRRSAYSYRQ